MAGKSDYLEVKVLDYVLRNVAYTAPTTVYVALYTVAPSDSGGGTEVSGNAYARQAATFSAAVSGAGTCSSSGDILFPVATPSNWGTIVAFGIFDAVTTGNLLYWNTMTNVTINANDQLKVASGNLVVTED